MKKINKTFQYDESYNSHPVIMDLEFIEEDVRYFDQITYEKGAFIIKQLVNILGHDKFKYAI